MASILECGRFLTMARDPTSLDYVEAKALLLPSGYGIVSTVKPWKDWELPLEPLAIDAQVTDLIERRDEGERDPRMRPRDELARLGVPCPYRYARVMTAFAAGDGTVRVEENERNRNTIAPALASTSEEAERIAQLLEAFLENHDLARLVMLKPRPSSSARMDLEQANKQASLINNTIDVSENCAKQLRKISALALAKKDRIAPGNRDGDLWAQAFVERLGYAWHDLTGKNPSPSSFLFIDFVRAAFKSLGGAKTRPRSWRTQVETVCARIKSAPAWDRWDRGERGTLPPGTRVRPIAEYEEMQRGRVARFEADVLSFVNAQTEEEARAAQIQLIGDWSFFPDTPEGRETIRCVREGRPHAYSRAIRPLQKLPPLPDV